MLVPFGEAAAQQAPDLSIIDRRIKEKEERPGRTTPRPEPRLKNVPAPAAAVEPFLLSGVVIEGATVFPPAALTGTYDAYLLKRIGDPEVDAILQAITERYQQAGYFLSRATAPAQEIAHGILRVRVVEGYVSRFSVAGNVPEKALLERYARPMLGERPIQLATVERALLHMTDLPGITLTPNLKAVDEQAGAYELVVDVEYKPVNAYARLDNRGTPDVGRLQGWIGGGLNGLLGFGESIQATFITVPDTPKELLYGTLNATVPVGSLGTVASLYGAYGTIDAGGSSAQFDTDS